MPWPPVIPPATVTDATDQATVHAGYHNQISSALTAIVAGPWITLPLASGWTQWPDAATPGPVPGYRLNGDRVELRGTINRTPATMGAFLIATIPVGFRCPTRVIGWAQLSNGGLTRIDLWGPVGGAGGNANELRTVLAATTGTVDLGYVSLYGISWSVTP